MTPQAGQDRGGAGELRLLGGQLRAASPQRFAALDRLLERPLLLEVLRGAGHRVAQVVTGLPYCDNRLGHFALAGSRHEQLVCLPRERERKLVNTASSDPCREEALPDVTLPGEARLGPLP